MSKAIAFVAGAAIGFLVGKWYTDCEYSCPLGKHYSRKTCNTKGGAASE